MVIEKVTTNMVDLTTRRALAPTRHIDNRRDCRERCVHVAFVFGALLWSDLGIAVEAS